MRKLLRELFYVPKYGKVKERTLYARLSSSVTVIVLCMAAMGFTAYAYFSAGVTSGANTIKAASFDVEVTIQNGVTVEPQADGSYLLAAGTYQVTVERTQDSTAGTGYCKVQIGAKTYVTCQLGKDVTAEDGWREGQTFTLEVTEVETVRVEIDACWGTAAHYVMGTIGEDADDLYIHDGEVITVSAEKAPNEEPDENEAELPTDPTDPTDPEPTDPEGTESAPTEPTRGEITITVKAKDTLYSLSRTYGVSIEAIMEYNGLTNRNLIITGSTLLIPPEGWEMPTEPDVG